MKASTETQKCRNYLQDVKAWQLPDLQPVPEVRSSAARLCYTFVLHVLLQAAPTEALRIFPRHANPFSLSQNNVLIKSQQCASYQEVKVSGFRIRSRDKLCLLMSEQNHDGKVTIKFPFLYMFFKEFTENCKLTDL